MTRTLSLLLPLLFLVPTVAADTIVAQAWLVFNGTSMQASGFANVYSDAGQRLDTAPYPSLHDPDVP
jgi:hypothetical protein